MTNKVVDYFKSFIGKEMHNSPSPVSRFLKGVLQEVEEGMLKIDFVIREEMTNPMGRLHGGAIGLILDDVIGATVFTLPTENHFVSVNINIDFLFSAKIGETLTAESKIVRKGKSIIHAECILINKRGRIVAKSTSNLVATNIKKENTI